MADFKLNFQNNAIEELRQLAGADRHSVLLEGPIGCGKSHVSRKYGKFLHTNDIIFVKPTVQEIRDALDMSFNLSSKTVFCIENLDLGVPAASYALLKFLEEPTSNVYIVVTCRSRFGVPDTIVSRSTCISLSYPTESDINTYAELTDPKKFKSLQHTPIWVGVKGLTDVDYVYGLSNAQIEYFTELKSEFKMTDTVSSLSWKLSHYSDRSTTNLVFVLNYLMGTIKNKRITMHISHCIRDLTTSRISQHAVLAKFLFDVKYGG
jgi:hypothetical protein